MGATRTPSSASLQFLSCMPWPALGLARRSFRIPLTCADAVECLARSPAPALTGLGQLGYCSCWAQVPWLREVGVSAGPLEQRHRASRRRLAPAQVGYPWLEGYWCPLQGGAVSRVLEEMFKLEPCGDVGGVGGLLSMHLLHSP